MIDEPVKLQPVIFLSSGDFPIVNRMEIGETVVLTVIGKVKGIDIDGDMTNVKLEVMSVNQGNSSRERELASVIIKPATLNRVSGNTVIAGDK